MGDPRAHALEYLKGTGSGNTFQASIQRCDVLSEAPSLGIPGRVSRGYNVGASFQGLALGHLW